MARRCPRSKPLGLARLERHRLAVMREGWLTVVRDPRAAVHGVLWDLALSDVRALDRYEGAQASTPRSSSRSSPKRGPKRALVYFGANAGPGPCARLYGRGPRRGARLAAAGRGLQRRRLADGNSPPALDGRSDLRLGRANPQRQGVATSRTVACNPATKPRRSRPCRESRPSSIGSRRSDSRT